MPEDTILGLKKIYTIININILYKEQVIARRILSVNWEFSKISLEGNSITLK
jgi:hypothetical protein